MATVLIWGYNSNTGVVGPFESLVFEGLKRLGLGWHGPFNSKQDAIDYYNRNKGANPGWKQPVGALDIGGAISNAQDSVQDKFKGFNLETWFVRVGEVLLGIVLIGVGLAKITGTANAVSTALKVVPKI